MWEGRATQLIWTFEEIQISDNLAAIADNNEAMGVWCYKFFNQEFLATLITNLSQPGKTRETSHESTKF